MSGCGPTCECLCRNLGVADGEILGTNHPLDCYRKAPFPLPIAAQGNHEMPLWPATGLSTRWQFFVRKRTMKMSLWGQKRTRAAQKADVRFAESGHFRTRSKAATQSFKKWQEWRSGHPPKVLIVVCRSMDCQSARRPTRKSTHETNG
jgi:hypothetical protein